MADPEQLPDAAAVAANAHPTPCGTSEALREIRKTSKNQILCEFSIRKSDWAYICLQHLSDPSKPKQALDGVTAQMQITAALSSFLGLHGTAIPFDILKLEKQDVWIRVPADYRAAWIAAVGGWTSSSHSSWRVKDWSHWNASACGKHFGQDLFD